MSQDTSVSLSVLNDHRDSGRIGNNTQVGNNTGYGSVGFNPLICSEGIEPNLASRPRGPVVCFHISL